ncbi:MAG: DNA replication/repair protein RecF [Bacteroidota bacterium]|jgi:DNA replication and repair protein RecF
MKILSTRLCNFRNHGETDFDFGSRMNVLLGENGMGKTNALEALSFLCLTKSFYAGADATVVQRGKSFFEIESVLESDNGKEFRIRVAYDDLQKKKKFSINNADIDKLSSVIGMFPVVVLSPENNAVTFGSPADRRRFVDIVISQSSSLYVDDVLEYRRVLRQRNKILSEAKGKECSEELSPWSEMLVHYGSRIVDKRNKFLTEFSPYIAGTYVQIVDEKEIPKIEYAPTVAIDRESTIEGFARAMAAKLEKKKNDELRFRTTLVGPHRDEIIFSLNGMSLKHFASQGQHKTFLVALKVAEFFYLKERCNETPIFLFDDVFSELDERRSQKLLSVVESLGQTFITTTSEKIFGGAEWNNERRKFFVENGAVAREAAE